MIFWIGIPVIIAIAILLWRIWSPKYEAQTEKTSTPGARLDIAGALFLIIALLGIVTGVMQGPEWGWSSALTLGTIIIGCGLLAMFVHRERTHAAPLLDLSLLNIPEFRGGVMIFAIFQMRLVFQHPLPSEDEKVV